METLVQLGQQYKGEFEDRYEGIRKRGAEQIQQAQDTVQQIQPELEAKQQEVVAILQDTNPVASGYAKPILEIFAWTAVLVFATNFASLVSGMVLAPIVGLFVGSAAVILIAYIALPAAVVYNADYSQSDAEIRFKLLAIAVAEGVLTGYLFSERYLSTSPPLAFVTPLVIAVVGSLAEEKIGASRIPLLGATIGTSAVIHLVIGLLTRQLSFAYMVLVTLYSVAGLAAVQFLLKETDFSTVYSSGKAYAIMFAYLVAVLYAKAVVFALFGGPKEAMQQQEPPAVSEK